MAIEVFNRYENKYVVDEKTLTKLQRGLSDYMELDAYNKQHETYTISNIYYDTPDSNLIRTSLAKPRYKEKLRLRAYGVPEGDAMVYVEIKKKFSGIVNKRRSAMRLDEAYAFLQSGNMPETKPYMNSQVLKEIEYVLQQHALVPTLYLSYDRQAYFGIGQHDIRVSFDTNIQTRRTNLHLESGMFGRPLLDTGTWLMEIKVAQSIPVWLCHLLSEHKLYPTSFSKYGAEYQQTLKEHVPQKIYTIVHEYTRQANQQLVMA